MENFQLKSKELDMKHESLLINTSAREPNTLGQDAKLGAIVVFIRYH